MENFANLDVLAKLTLACVVGFLIGFEREWTQEREQQAHTFAGARTFTLIALIGALGAHVSPSLIVAAAGLLAVGALTIVAYRIEAREAPGRGGTTEMAIFATYLLGVAAGRGEALVAGAGGVAVAAILSGKARIEGWARALDRAEIHAALRFLAIAVVALPILPDRDFGPYRALNAREIGMMVVLISGLSFAGYWLVKLLGPERGVMATGLVGGLASSTATTLALSRFVREGKSAPLAAAGGVVLANVVMLARVGLLLAAVARPALAQIATSLAAAALTGAVAAFALWRSAERLAGGEPSRAMALGNPFELRPALFFALLLAAISLAAALSVEQFGVAGLYAVAALSGLVDVDAVTLSAGRQAMAGAVGPEIAGAAILIAISANIAAKGAIAASIAGVKAGGAVLIVFALMTAAGAAAFLSGL